MKEKYMGEQMQPWNYTFPFRTKRYKNKLNRNCKWSSLKLKMTCSYIYFLHNNLIIMIRTAGIYNSHLIDLGHCQGGCMTCRGGCKTCIARSILFEINFLEVWHFSGFSRVAPRFFVSIWFYRFPNMFSNKLEENLKMDNLQLVYRKLITVANGGYGAKTLLTKKLLCWSI